MYRKLGRHRELHRITIKSICSSLDFLSLMYSCSLFTECIGDESCKKKEQVVTFVKNHCASATPTMEIPATNYTSSQCIMATSTVTATSACSQFVMAVSQQTIQCSTATTTTAISPSCAQPHPGSSHSTITSLKSEVNITPLAVLGALLGLSVVLLAVVTTGWVWTCCLMKKRGEKNLAQNR